jgi:hypothetical protein
MFDGDGSETMELQARQIADNATRYNASAPCPTCGVIMNPVEFIQNRGHCYSCLSQKRAARIKSGMA